MIKIANWDKTEARFGNNSAAKIPVGGYGFTVLKVEASEKDGKQRIYLYVDVDDNSEWKGYFLKLFNRRKDWAEKNRQPVPKYPLIYSCRTTDDEGNSSPTFKGLITVIEKSNPGYNFLATDGDEKTLKGKKLGIVIREEEYDYDGKHGISIRPWYVCKYSDAASQPIPERKKLDKKVSSGNPFSKANMTPAEDDDGLPF